MRSWRRSSARRPRSAGRWQSTQSATAPTATPSTPSRRPVISGSRSGCDIGSSTPNASMPPTSPASPSSASRARSSSPTRRPTGTWPSASGATGSSGSYAFRSLWDSGAVVVNGSDAPVEELDPLAGIRAGVLRTIDDRPGWRLDEALTVEQAIIASTVTPAWLAGDERRRGQAAARVPRRSRRALPRPVHLPGRRARDGATSSRRWSAGRWVFPPPPWD